MTERPNLNAPGRNPALGCAFLGLVPLGLVVGAAVAMGDMLMRGQSDNWGLVIALLSVALAIPLVAIVVILVNRQFFKEANEELNEIQERESDNAEDR